MRPNEAAFAAADAPAGGAERYLSGFGNEFATEAVAGALPVGQNSPQKTPYGLYAEQISGSAFTAPRGANRRSWFYRLRPSAGHLPYAPFDERLLRSGPFTGVPTPPNRLRWDPLPPADRETDFVEGLVTFAGNGDPSTGAGLAVHLYAITRSMADRAFSNADGELLIVPQDGALFLTTEFGVLRAAPGEIAVIPRGVRFRVEIQSPSARGYVCENYGAPFRLPELGPIGANGLANPRDFLAPAAAYEDIDRPFELIQKFGGRLWSATIAHSPFDVVAWHGNYAPYKYDLARFNAIGSISFDHPDPSIFTVLTSPSETPGVANCDFVIFPPRWMVAEHTFRQPWFHRNIMSEFMGLIHGVYDAKADGFLPGGASLHNCMSAHGPDKASYDRSIAARDEPEKYAGTLAFMFESRWVIKPTAYALQTPLLQTDYDQHWAAFEKARLP